VANRRTEIGALGRRSYTTARLRLRSRLRRARGDISATARLMNCSGDTILRWVVRLGLVDELRRLRRTVGSFAGLHVKTDTLRCRTTPVGQASTRS